MIDDKSGEYSFDLKKFKLLDKIGKGQFGKVFKVKEIQTGLIYAAKISIQLIDDEDESKSLIRNMTRELNIISRLNHPAIVKFIGFSPVDFNNDLKPTIITEYIGDSLNDIIKKEKRGISDPNWNDTKKIITLYGIASAMSYLHAHKIIHRDLKPANILMDDNLYPKIADFGLSKVNHQNDESMTLSTVGIKGTITFLPPESLFECQYTEACDVWAFSMIAFELLTLDKPFDDCNFTKLIIKLRDHERPAFKSPISSKFKSLIERC